MRFSFLKLWIKLSLVALLSSVVCAGALRAHEVLPTIADLTVQDGQATLALRANIEAFLSEIDLDDLEDTDLAAGVDRYDALRALPQNEIAAMLPDLVDGWNALPLLAVDGTPVALSVQDFQMVAPPDAEQPRQSLLTLQGPVAVGAVAAVFSWPKGQGALVLRQQGVEDPFTGYVDPGTASPAINLGGGGADSGWQAFANYVPVGFDHILPKGLDHILFVLGLFFLSTAWRPLLWQVTAFTLAHTVTLALGALGWVNVPGSIVEPLIAASIVYVAVENVFMKGLSPWRPVVIFGFGLLHGLGFASVLGEFGLPAGQFIPALIGFNVGVELGQLTVIALAFLAVGWFASKPWYRRAISVPASCVIAAVGAYWFVERVFL